MVPNTSTIDFAPTATLKSKHEGPKKQLKNIKRYSLFYARNILDFTNNCRFGRILTPQNL
jgi:hypothetical protein